jgi:hypothetical protein
LLSGAIRAEDAAPPAAAPAKYELQKKSAFTLRTETRAPFWPIGHVPNKTASPVQVAAAPKPKLDESAFTVTSILVGNPSLAVVNGRAYSEGELLRMPKGSAPLKVRVQQITDGAVTLQHERQTLVVAMKRPELPERRPEADVLDEDR